MRKQALAVLVVTNFVLVTALPRYALGSAGDRPSRPQSLVASKAAVEARARDTRVALEAFRRWAKSAGREDVRRISTRFVRLEAIWEARDAGSRGRSAVLANLGVTWRSDGTDLVVSLNGTERRIKDVGQRVLRQHLSEADSPDGSRVAKEDYWEEWEEAEDEAEEMLASIESMEADAEAQLDEIYNLQVTPEEDCAPSGTSSTRNPCIDAMNSAIQDTVAGIAYYATSKQAIQSALNTARTQVQYYQSAYAAGTISAAVMADSIIGAGVALIAAIGVPWYVALGAAAAVGYTMYLLVECILAIEPSLQFREPTLARVF